MPRKQWWLVGILGICCASFGCSGPSARVTINPKITEFPVKTVAVMPFEGVPVTRELEPYVGLHNTNYPNNGEIVSDILAAELLDVGGYSYLERSQVRKVLEEKGFSLADLVHQKTASEIGKLIGADAVILGTVSKMYAWQAVIGTNGCEIVFSARMVHTETGVVLWSASVTRQAGGTAVSEVTREECRSIAEQIRAKLSAKPATP